MTYLVMRVVSTRFHYSLFTCFTLFTDYRKDCLILWDPVQFPTTTCTNAGTYANMIRVRKAKKKFPGNVIYSWIRVFDLFAYTITWK